MRRGHRCNSGGVGLDETKIWNLEKDVGTRSPLLYVLDWDTNLSYAAFKWCQGGAARADVVVCKAHSPDEAVDDIQCDRNVYVDAGVQRGRWQMNHYGNDESEESDDVLDDKELVGKVPKRR